MKSFRRGALALLALAAFAALASEANAQLGPGRSGMSTSGRLENVQAFRDLRGFGSCYARTQRTDALALIATTPDSREETEAISRRVSGERSTCMFGGTNMSVSNVYTRGAIAEGLLRSGGVPETYWLSAPAAGSARTLHEAARCYTTGHRATVRGLLETQPGSQEETAAVGALWSDFRPCIARFRVRLNAPWIRYLLAEALLRLDPSAPRP